VPPLVRGGHAGMTEERVYTAQDVEHERAPMLNRGRGISGSNQAAIIAGLACSPFLGPVIMGVTCSFIQ